MQIEHIQKQIDQAYESEEQISSGSEKAVHETISLLNQGKIRVAESIDGKWMVNEWIKKGIILYFRIRKMIRMEAGPFEYFDKIPLKKDFDQQQVRVVPPGTVRYGAYLAPGVVVMPGYVNIGAYVDSGSMVDTHATVGSCAQIGKRVHLAGAARIGGVLEPPQGKPVIVEDDAFIGSAVSLLEGTLVRREAVLGAGVVITSSTRIMDVSGNQVIEYRGEIPERSVVIPGTYTKEFPAGKFNVQCALIIGKRNITTDKKVSLNQALRDFGVTI
jgi:2,3,4,5-tetrahydropyridine-2-carboxylate N-succinyltransferase